jgi:hypothetical protein
MNSIQYAKITRFIRSLDTACFRVEALARFASFRVGGDLFLHKYLAIKLMANCFFFKKEHSIFPVVTAETARFEAAIENSTTARGLSTSKI